MVGFHSQINIKANQNSFPSHFKQTFISKYSNSEVSKTSRGYLQLCDQSAFFMCVTHAMHVGRSRASIVWLLMQFWLFLLFLQLACLEICDYIVLFVKTFLIPKNITFISVLQYSQIFYGCFGVK